MKGFLFLGSLAVLAVLVHTSLYGWRQGPVNVVRLNRRQWAILAAFALPPLAAGTLIFAFRRALWARLGDGAGGVALLWCIGALLAIVIGGAPRVDESDDDPGTPPVDDRDPQTSLAVATDQRDNA